jgi:poly(3-hydroxybutyrate) depolymerase
VHSGAAPRSLEELMANLLAEDRRISVQRVGAGRYIAYLPGTIGHEPGRLRLVGADPTTSAGHVIRAIEQAVTEDDARVMLVGSAAGGTIAAEIAATAASDRFVVDQVVTAGAPSAQVPRIPEATRVLSLEDRSDPVALLGSLINARTANRLTVVFDGGDAEGTPLYVAGAKAADTAEHPELRAEITRMQDLGYLAG